MKYIVKFREAKGEEEDSGLRDAVRGGMVRKVAASGRNEQKRECERKGESAKKKERLETKPVIMRLPGATAADCYLVSTPTTLSPAILLPSTY